MSVAQGTQLKSLAERFAAKVQIEPDGCWRWTGAAHPLGYGNIYTEGTMRPAHRVAYELWRGPVPGGLELDHLCRHPYCVNPWHLEPVTHAVNVLRGTGASARNAAKTQCPKGHPYSGDNVRYRANGDRVCRACDLARKRAQYSRPANKDKTHCPHGHEYTPENTSYSRGKRYCRTCHREHERERAEGMRQAFALTTEERSSYRVDVNDDEE